MMGRYPFGETVQILDGTATSKDEYNDDVASWPVKATYEKVAVWPGDANATAGNEVTDQGGDRVYIGLVVSLPDGADIAPVDRVVARGEIWNVVGDPQEFNSSLSGWRPGRPVALTRVTG